MPLHADLIGEEQGGDKDGQLEDYHLDDLWCDFY